ncbi:MAG TPA: diguanylate cyclase, partial [Clostridia bacterium]|nr:diguanylate cyclase [Clostridia bacterium]
LINKYGKSVPIADSAAPIRDKSGTIFGVVMVFRDVTLEKAQENRILFLSYHDALTGLYNRRYLESEARRILSAEELPITVVMGDVNGLKITNDVFGHKFGDSLLQDVAKVLRRNCRSGDIIIRWGGDEFVMILPGTGEEQAERRLEKIRLDCEKHSGNDRIMSVSTGYAVLHTRSEDLERKLQEAEEAMYHQKLLAGKSYRNTIISALLATLNEKSMETEEHAQRLQLFCQEIGKELHLSENEMNDLSLLAILHDIGKVGVPKHILEKSGPLSPEEWKEMRKHSEIGYRIAQTTPELSKVSEYILAHHERWDGTGYPGGLKEDQIPLLCRILAVADAYDAMTNDRVYRKALSQEAAKQELLSNAGTQFDPHVVDLFFKICENSSH